MEKLRRKLTILFVGMTMAAFTAILGILAWNTVSGAFGADRLFLTNIAKTIAEEFPDDAVRQNYARRYGIAFFTEGRAVIAPEGLPLDGLTLEMRKAKPSASETVCSDPGSLQINLELYALAASGKPYYGILISVFSKWEGARVISMFAPRQTVWTILRDRCAFYPILWIGMLLLLLRLSRYLIGKALEPVQTSIESQKNFIAAASHELKAPLAVIGANAETALAHPEDAEKRLHIISSQCRYMGKLVEALLELETRDSGHWTMHIAPVDVDSLMIEVWESSRESVLRKGMELHLNLEDTAFPKLEADADRLKQALGILLDNACTYGADPKGIRLGAAFRGNMVFFSVADHGPGIPDAEKESVFQRFYRGDRSRTERNHFGLGLSIAREIALAHHGQLHLSDTLGGGCTAEIVIPIK